MAPTDAETDRRRDGLECPDCGSYSSPSDAANEEQLCEECGRIVREADQGCPASEDEEPESDRTEPEPTPDWSERYAVSNSTEDQVATAFGILETLGDALGLSDEVRADAAALYSTAAKHNLTSGRPLEETVAAAVHLGAQRAGEPRPLTAVAEVVRTRETALVGVTKHLRRELDEAHAGSRPAEYLPYLCQTLGVTERVEDDARRLVAQMESTGTITGCNPAGVAGAALYLAGDTDLTQRAIAQVAGVTTETIRVRLQNLRALENAGEEAASSE